MKIVGLDLGNDIGYALHNTDKGSPIDVCVPIKKKTGWHKLLDSLKDVDYIVTAEPNMFGRAMYNILRNQFKMIGVLEYLYPEKLIIIKEAKANKEIIGHGRPKKEDVLYYINEHTDYLASTHDEADAIKFILYFLKNVGTYTSKQ